jgi:hypothetical protein
VAALDACCRLSGSGDAFFIISKSGPPFETLGAVWFKDGRVSMLRRDRASSDSVDTASFALTLFRLVSEASGPNGAVAVVRTETSELSNATTRTIRLQFGDGRALTVTLLSADDPNLGRSTEIAELHENPTP